MFVFRSAKDGEFTRVERVVDPLLFDVADGRRRVKDAEEDV